MVGSGSEVINDGLAHHIGLGDRQGGEVEVVAVGGACAIGGIDAQIIGNTWRKVRNRDGEVGWRT